jgi:hypothetical protein
LRTVLCTGNQYLRAIAMLPRYAVALLVVNNAPGCVAMLPFDGAVMLLAALMSPQRCQDDVALLPLRSYSAVTTLLPHSLHGTALMLPCCRSEATGL